MSTKIPRLTPTIRERGIATEFLHCEICGTNFEVIIAEGSHYRQCCGREAMNVWQYKAIKQCEEIDRMNPRKLREVLISLTTHARTRGQVVTEGFLCSRLAILNLFLSDSVPKQLIEVTNNNPDSITGEHQPQVEWCSCLECQVFLVGETYD